MTDMIRQQHEPAQARNVRLAFALIYPDKVGKLVQRDVGVTFVSGRRTNEMFRTLRELKLQTGDFVNVAVLAA